MRTADKLITTSEGNASGSLRWDTATAYAYLSTLFEHAVLLRNARLAVLLVPPLRKRQTCSDDRLIHVFLSARLEKVAVLPNRLRQSERLT